MHPHTGGSLRRTFVSIDCGNTYRQGDDVARTSSLVIAIAIISVSATISVGSATPSPTVGTPMQTSTAVAPHPRDADAQAMERLTQLAASQTPEEIASILASGKPTVSLLDTDGNLVAAYELPTMPFMLFLGD